MRFMPMMSIRKITGWVVAIATAVAAALALATPAQAATITVTATCSSGGVVVDNNDVVAVPGDIIFVRNLTGGAATLSNASGLTFGSTSLSDGAGTNGTVAAASGGFQIASSGAGCGGFTASVTFSATPRTSGPPPIIQQFGKPVSGTCDAAASATLNWAGVAGGGWGDSWAQWMNAGLGGPVCTRTLSYSLSQRKWVIG